MAVRFGAKRNGVQEGLEERFTFLVTMLVVLSLVNIRMLTRNMRIRTMRAARKASYAILPRRASTRRASQSRVRGPSTGRSPPRSKMMARRKGDASSRGVSITLGSRVLAGNSLATGIDKAARSSRVTCR